MTRTDTGFGGVACYVFHPSDAVSAFRCTEIMANTEGLCYMRTHRPEAKFLYPADERFELRGCKQLRSGRQLTLVSSGFILHQVLDAAEELAEKGVDCSVFDAYTFPLSAEPILDAARASGGVILSVEDNYTGGLHAELAEAAAEVGDVRVYGMTARRIPKSGRSADEVFESVGVGRAQIIERGRALAKQ
jgi:transketolase